ncbi:hypothetical protein [Leucobacter sp. gxy201]|uniref:hypothetical protein n=1 Tax=Leucobacter sp. gxy201 TaxID=2957200 RepID=UPI003DA146C7
MHEHDDTPRRTSRTAAVALGAAALTVAFAASAVGCAPQGAEDEHGAPTSTAEAGSEAQAGSGGDAAGAQAESGAGAQASGEAQAGTVAPRKVLPREMGGQEAIDALGDRIDRVASRNALTVDELKDLLLRDASASVTPSGDIVYRD